MTITHTTFAAHLDTENAVSTQDAESYSRHCAEAFRKLFPEAEIVSRIEYNVSGATNSFVIEDECGLNHYYVLDLLHAAERHVCESGVFWS